MGRFETITLEHLRPGYVVPVTTSRAAPAPFRWNVCGTTEQALDAMEQRHGDPLPTVRQVDSAGHHLDPAGAEAIRVAHLAEFARTVARAPWLRTSGSRRAVAALDAWQRST